jgi:hypothetical protein
LIRPDLEGDTDLKVAIGLVGNLVERLERNGCEADGFLTSRETEALEELLALAKRPPRQKESPHVEQAPEQTHERSAEADISAPAIANSQPSSGFDLNTRAIAEPPDRDVTLCLDFGTAFSKAALWDESKETGDPGDGAACCRGLPIGRQAGETALVYPISSSVYVSGDGAIHFGPAAVAESIRENDPRRARFDNPKEHLSKAVQETFYTQVLPPEFDPTGSGLTYYEVLQAYLAYLTSQATRPPDNVGMIACCGAASQSQTGPAKSRSSLKRKCVVSYWMRKYWRIQSTQIFGRKGYRFRFCVTHYSKRKVRASVPTRRSLNMRYASLLLPRAARSRS